MASLDFINSSCNGIANDISMLDIDGADISEIHENINYNSQDRQCSVEDDLPSYSSPLEYECRADGDKHSQFSHRNNCSNCTSSITYTREFDCGRDSSAIRENVLIGGCVHGNGHASLQSLNYYTNSCGRHRSYCDLDISNQEKPLYRDTCWSCVENAATDDVANECQLTKDRAQSSNKCMLDSIYWETILKADKDGDNLIFVAILLDEFSLCINMLSLIPSQTLIRARRNDMYQTALHLAALTDNAMLVRRFLVAGVQVDGQDKFGNTALHIACKRGNMVVAEALLQPVRYVETKQNIYEVSFQRIPQNLEIRNYEGQTCFMIAAINGDTDMMDLLISKHADINVKDIKSGMTCLHFTAESGNEKLVIYLLKKRTAAINARTYAGFTALDIANIRGHSFIAYKLLCEGAMPKLKSLDSVDFLAESDSDEMD